MYAPELAMAVYRYHPDLELSQQLAKFTLCRFTRMRTFKQAVSQGFVHVNGFGRRGYAGDAGVNIRQLAEAIGTDSDIAGMRLLENLEGGTGQGFVDQVNVKSRTFATDLVNQVLDFASRQ